MKPYPIGHSVKLLLGQFESEANRALKSLDLTTAQAQLLIILNNSTDTLLPQKKLEASVGLSQATVSGIISRLAAKELVTLSRDGEDRRVQLVAITPKGAKCCLSAFEILKATKEYVLSTLSSEEKSAVSDFLTLHFK